MIQEQNIKLLKSEVMDDVTEGGGQATGNAITDGVSNAIFPDISELDRTYGRVNLRKVFVGVQTPDTDKYFGANVIIADPPDDQRVACTLFTTEDNFDRRTSAAGRVEAYLFKGPRLPGYLYENHIAGMRAISILQREGYEVPAIGRTLVVSQGANEQYVRVTAVSQVTRTFTDSQGDYKRVQVTLELSDSLRYNFTGYTASRIDPNMSASIVFDTLVADAARYYGITKLVEDAAIADLSAKGETIFTQLVPSAQTEVPATDVRTNLELYSPMVSSTGTLSMTTSAVLSPSASLFIGASIIPGSLQITGAATLTDDNGALMSGLTPVGTVDYQNGVVSITAGGPTYSGSKTISYKVASSPSVVTQSMTIPVTQEGRSLSFATTINPIPAPGTLQIHYMVQGNWYVLREQGGGAIRGADSAFGAGQLNFTTGGITVTYGALPDVDSSILLYWGDSTALASTVNSADAPRAFFSAEVGYEVVPGTVTISWDNGGAKTATESGGVISGDAVGQIIDYATGKIEFSPNSLPAEGTAYAVNFTSGTSQSPGDMQNFTSQGTTWKADLGTAIIGHTFSAEVYYDPEGVAGEPRQKCKIADDGAGNIVLRTYDLSGNEEAIEVGTINYATGVLTINKTKTATYKTTKSRLHYFGYRKGTGAGGLNTNILVDYYTENNGEMIGGTTVVDGSVRVSVEYYTVSRTGTVYTIWGGSIDEPALSNISFIAVGLGAVEYDGTFDALKLRIKTPQKTNLISSSLRFTLGPTMFIDQSGTLVKSIDPATGTGTTVGSMDSVSATATIDDWTGATSPTATINAGLLQKASAAIADTGFRAPVAPIRPGNFTIAATREYDGATITGTADLDGYINTPNMIGTIDYNTGVARVFFGTKTPNPRCNLAADMTEFVPGVTAFYPTACIATSVRFSAVSYTYLPLDADILGIDAVRLPSDGRVPIFRTGDVAVVHNTAQTNPATVSNGQTINVGRTRLSRLRVIGNDGNTISAGYTADLDAGMVTFDNVSGYSQPVKVEHRIEDMALVSDAQINGRLSFTRQLTHDFPANTSFISSAMIIGDMRARVPVLFDQATWNSVWQDTVSGSNASASYNSVLYPIEVTNAGAITEQWVIHFTNSTTFNVIGKNVGQIFTGTTAADLAPINPATGVPYFTIQSEGWGSGWSAGNALRLNTVGALAPVWIARTIQQGTPTAPNDAFTLLVRGDVDNP